MKSFFLFMPMMLGLILGSQAQKSGSQKPMPKEDIKVNREYDENGNLIKFDSTYSYSFSGDTTLLRSYSPDDLSDLFGDHFNFMSDSIPPGSSFFDAFDQRFFNPFSSKRDSLLMKKFGINPYFHHFGFNTDSLALHFKDFDELFNNFTENKNDSIPLRFHGQKPSGAKPESLDGFMKMLREQMQKMEEQQRKFQKEQPGLKEL